ncbi:MAG: DUF421 domain-containing protein [Bacillota bacterium]
MPNWLLTLIRSLISFIVLLFFARLMGKKQVGQLTFFDYVVGITIGSISAAASADLNLRISDSLVAVLVWGLLPFVIGLIDLKSRRFRVLTDGHPTVLVKNGRVMENSMARSRISVDDLTMMLREKNAFSVADVEFAVLEPNGQLSVQKKSDAANVTLRDLGLVGSPGPGIPSIVISDGQWRTDVLQELGLTKAWISAQLKAYGANDVRQVMLAQVDANGILYVDLHDDSQGLQLPNQDRILAAKIAKLAADLRSFELETHDQGARSLYHDMADRMHAISQELAPYLK